MTDLFKSNHMIYLIDELMKCSHLNRCSSVIRMLGSIIWGKKKKGPKYLFIYCSFQKINLLQSNILRP